MVRTGFYPIAYQLPRERKQGDVEESIHHEYSKDFRKEETA